MSYFPTIEEMAAEAERWDKLSPEEKQKEIALKLSREQRRLEEKKKAEEEALRLRQEAVADVRSRTEMFRKMVNQAYDDKDTVRYVYGVAALVIINNLEKGIDRMATDDIRSVIPESVPAEIGLEDMDYLKQIIPRFGGHAYIDIPLHEDITIRIRSFTLCDLVGCAILTMKDPEMKFDIFS